MNRRFNVYWDVGGLNPKEYNYTCTFESLKNIIKEVKEYREWTLIKVEEEVHYTLERNIGEFE